MLQINREQAFWFRIIRAYRILAGDHASCNPLKTRSCTMWKWSSYLNKNTLKAPVWDRQYRLFREIIATYGILDTHTRHMSKMQDTLMSLSAVTYSYHTDLGRRGWRGRRKKYHQTGLTPYLCTPFSSFMWKRARGTSNNKINNK